MSEFGPEGLTIDTLEETTKELSDSLKTNHGDDFKSDDPQSISGQDVAIIGGMIREQNELVLGLADMFNPNASKGFFLANLVQFNGITKNESAHSTVPLEVTAGPAPTTILKDSIVTNPDEDHEWLVDDDTPLLALETKVVSATAKDEGPFEADPGTLTVIKTPLYSWAGVTNPAKASPGKTEETDPDLRNRRDIASKQTGQTSEQAIFKDLTEIEGVESVNTYVNETEDPDPITGQLPGRIWCIIRGGSDQDIAKVLTESVSGGVITFGSIMVVYTDVNIDPLGVEYSKDYTRYFDRPEDVPTYIDIVLTKESNYPPDGDVQMRQAIIDYYAGDFTINERKVPGFAIGKTVKHSRLYSPINSIPGHSVDSLYLDETTWGTGVADLPMERNQQGFVSEAIIRINGVVGP